MTDAYTENLADFGYRELAMAKDLLVAWFDGDGLPSDFEGEGVRIAFNRNSGYVFLTNDEYQVAMEVEGKLYSWYWLGYAGTEGFLDNLIQEFDNGNIDENDYEELANICEANGNTDKAEEIRKQLEYEQSDEAYYATSGNPMDV